MKWLAEKIASFVTEGADDGFVSLKPRHDDGAQVRMKGTGTLQQLQPVHPWHEHVGQQQIDRLVLKNLQRLLAARDVEHVAAFEFEHAPIHAASNRIIICNKHGRHASPISPSCALPSCCFPGPVAVACSAPYLIIFLDVDQTGGVRREHNTAASPVSMSRLEIAWPS